MSSAPVSSQHDAYPLPRATGEKEAETERLDSQHEMFKLALGSIYSAPLPENVSSVLDLGCGTGIWACQFAEGHPSAQVLGVDIVPPTAPPQGRLVPKNCTFVYANIEDDWAFAKSISFDFVFARLLVTALKDWPALFRRVYQHLRPGGIFEIYEAVLEVGSNDGASSRDSAIMRWHDQVRDFVGARGVNPDAALTFPKIAKGCGFEIIQDHPVKMYLDPDVAALHLPNGAKVATELASDLSRVVTIMTDKVFTSEAQRALAAEALDDLAQNSGRRGYHCIHTHRVFRKPAAAE